MTAIIITFPPAQKLAPFYVAQAVRAAFAPMILALEIQSVYWETWSAVYGVRTK